VLSHSRLAGLAAKPGPEVVYVDQAAMIAAEKGDRLKLELGLSMLASAVTRAAA
jgi:hypothetical protein